MRPMFVLVLVLVLVLATVWWWVVGGASIVSESLCGFMASSIIVCARDMVYSDPLSILHIASGFRANGIRRMCQGDDQVRGASFVCGSLAR